MKIKILFFVVGAGLFLAGCSDNTKQMEADMHTADSLCTANTTMLMDSITGIQHTLDSMKMAAAMRTSTTTTTTKTQTGPNSPTTGTKKATELTPKKTTNVDIHKKGGATGGN